MRHYQVITESNRCLVFSNLNHRGLETKIHICNAYDDEKKHFHARSIILVIRHTPQFARATVYRGKNLLKFLLEKFQFLVI